MTPLTMIRVHLAGLWKLIRKRMGEDEPREPALDIFFAFVFGGILVTFAFSLMVALLR